MVDRTFAGLTATEWTAIAAVMSCLATIALVVVTGVYVRFTHRLVEATAASLVAEFDVVLTVYVWQGHPFATNSEGTLGPFPEQVRIESMGTRVFIHGVLFDGRHSDPLEKHVGAVVGPVRLIDPSTPPVSLARGEVLYGGFEGAVPALESTTQEVGITIDYGLTPKGNRESYTRRIRPSTVRSLD